MKKLYITMIAGLVVAGSLPVAMAENQKTVNHRSHRQQERIHQGVKSGELTKQEAVRLEKQEHHIKQMEKRAEADGKLSPRERHRLEEAQNHESKMIYHQKHDQQTHTGANTTTSTNH